MDQSLMNMLLWFAIFFGIIYFIIIRPNNKQQKERRAMLESLKVKDKVITIGGIHGTITKVNEDTVIIKVAKDVELEFLRSAVQSVVNRDYKEEAAKKNRKVKVRKDTKLQEQEEAKNEPKSQVQEEVKNESAE
ncbi:MAG TPA: preprotein translocase subunit YajC [Peptococcaceae bacterium]|nr:preprotein translocase subunit YajC [Peptococcaceae bacterium]